MWGGNILNDTLTGVKINKTTLSKFEISLQKVRLELSA